MLGAEDKKKLARPEGFEPPTLCLEGRRSFQLSYGRVSADSKTFPPRGHSVSDALTICSDGRRSLLTLLANDNKSPNCSSFWLRFAESGQSACLVSRCSVEFRRS